MSKWVTFTVHHSTLNLIPSLALVTWGFFLISFSILRSKDIHILGPCNLFSSFLISSRAFFFFFFAQPQDEIIRFSLYSLKAIDTSSDFDVQQHLLKYLSDTDPQCCSTFQSQSFWPTENCFLYYYICQQTLIQINSIWTFTKNIFLALLP